MYQVLRVINEIHTPFMVTFWATLVQLDMLGLTYTEVTKEIFIIIDTSLYSLNFLKRDNIIEICHQPYAVENVKIS